jgi:nucleotide-binding universal stress UspA family protein
MYRRILVPIDHSARSQQAARAALEVARRFKAPIVVLHVVAPYAPHALGQIRTRMAHQLTADEYRMLAARKARSALERVAALAKTARVACETALVEDADAAAAIIEQARARRSDLIVMASSGRTGIERIFMGSVTSAVLARTNRHVLVCR